MGGAAEAILEELLSQSRTQTQLLQQLARGFTGGGGGGGAGPAAVATGFQSVLVATRALQTGFNVLSGFVSRLFGFFGQLVGGALRVVDAFDSLGQTALKTGARLSDFFNAFEKIPVLGKFFGLFTGLIENQEALLDSYRQLSRSGATFTGNLIDMVRATARAGLSLSELQQVVAENRQIFSTLGAGNVQAGFDRFINVQNKLMGPNSEYAKSLGGLGLTASETANYLATVLQSQGAIDRNKQINEKALAKQTVEYVEQLDALTRLTGMQKEEMDAAVKKAQNEQRFNLFFDTLNDAQKQFVKIGLAEAATRGADSVEEFKSAIREVRVPVTKFGENIVQMSGKMLYDVDVLSRELANATKDTDALAVMMKATSGAITETTRNFGSLDPRLVQFMDGFAALDPVLAQGRKLLKEGPEASLAAAREQAAAAKKGSAANMAFMEQEAKNFGLQFGEVGQGFRALFAPILQVVTKGMFNFSNGLLEAANSLMSDGKFGKAIEDVSKWLEAAFTDIYGAFKEGGIETGFKKLFEKLGQAASTVWGVIKGPIAEAFMNLVNWIKPHFIDLLEFMTDKIKEFINPLTDEEDIKENELERKVNSARRQMEYLNSVMRETPAGSDYNTLLADYRKRKTEYDLAVRQLNNSRETEDTRARSMGMRNPELMPTRQRDNIAAALNVDNVRERLRNPDTSILASKEETPIDQRDSVFKKSQQSFDTYNLQLNMYNELKTFNSNMETQNRILRGMNGNLLPN